MNAHMVLRMRRGIFGWIRNGIAANGIITSPCLVSVMKIRS